MTRCRARFTALFFALSLLGGPGSAEAQGAARPGSARFEAGMQSYRERRYMEAMDAFLDVLEKDPANAEARRYQSAALRALVAERESLVRSQSMELIRLSLHQREKDAVVSNLTREAAVKMDVGDLLGASDFLYKAKDLMPGHPEVLRGMARAKGLIGVRINQLHNGSGGFLFMRNALSGLNKLADGANREAATLFQQALFLVSAGEEAESQLQGFLNRARTDAGDARARPAPAGQPIPASLAAPARQAEAPRVFGPPSPLPGWTRPIETPVVARKTFGPPSSSFPGAKAPATVSAPPATAASEPLHIPDMPDQAKSAEAYIRGVTDYMAGRSVQAAAAMREALRLNPDNQRAQRMLDRIEKEGPLK